jgi:predicted nucleotidyltransferase
MTTQLDQLDVVAAFDRSREIVEQRGRTVLFMAVKGSVVYDLPGTHRDIDVRVVYREPTMSVLQLHHPRETIEVMEGSLDLVAWELKKFLGHLLSHNGNFIEMLLTPNALTRASMFEGGDTLRAFGPKFLTQRLHRYYRGYAYSQLKRASQQIRTGKGAIYTYREMYAGLWLMLRGELVFPWAELRDKIESSGLYRSKLLGEFDMDRERVTPEIIAAMRVEFNELTALLDDAVSDSPLPVTYDAYEDLNEFLILQRARDLAGRSR